MIREQIDEIYHQLRVVSNNASPKQLKIINGLADHLLGPTGDYPALLRFLSYYGGEYIVPRAHEMLQKTFGGTAYFDRVVDLGSGYGWFGAGLSSLLELPESSITSVDKRHWTGNEVIIDLETDLVELQEYIQSPSTLVVMCELLHCVDNPKELLSVLKHNTTIIVEYAGVKRGYAQSYERQISRYGCMPVTKVLAEVLANNKNSKAEHVGPYAMVLIPSDNTINLL